MKHNWEEEFSAVLEGDKKAVARIRRRILKRLRKEVENEGLTNITKVGLGEYGSGIYRRDDDRTLTISPTISFLDPEGMKKLRKEFNDRRF